MSMLNLKDGLYSILIAADRELDAAEFAGMIRERMSLRHHQFDHEWDDWHYVEGCGCEACGMWEMWVTGMDHPLGIDNEREWWDHGI